MFRFLCVWIVVLCVSLRVEEEELSLEIAALIEKTNALESFRLVYEGEGKSEEGRVETTIELVYRAPDFARVRTSDLDGDMDLWLDGERVHYLYDGEWTTAVLEPDGVTAVLDELFPEPAALGPGLFAYLELRRYGERGMFSMGFSRSDTGRSCLLGWLASLQRWPGVTTEGSWLTWEGDRLECRVSRETGVLESVALSSETGEMTLRLRDQQLDEELDPELLTLPPEALHAEFDPELSHALDKSFPRRREEAFVRVECQLASEECRWNDSTRENWRAVIDAIYRDPITFSYSDWLEELQEYVEELAEWAANVLAAGDSDEGLEIARLHVAACRDQLLLGFEEALEQYVESLPAFETEVEPRKELLDIEQAVLASLFDEILSTPVLEAFDEKTEAALER